MRHAHSGEDGHFAALSGRLVEKHGMRRTSHFRDSRLALSADASSVDGQADGDILRLEVPWDLTLRGGVASVTDSGVFRLLPSCSGFLRMQLWGRDDNDGRK